MPASLRYSLQSQSRYVLGKPVVLGFTLESVASADLWVLKWYTPLEGLKGKILDIRCDEVEVPYEGRMVKRGSPGPDDYVLLHPGESARAEFDLSVSYSLKECQTCRVTFKGRIHDVVESLQQLPPATHDASPVEVSGSAVSFRIDK